MKFQKRAMATAISVALSSQAGAAVTIDQLINYSIDYYADNVIDIEAAVTVSLGFDDLGNVVPSTQLGSLQANAVGWGTTGGNATSALDIAAGVSYLEVTQDLELATGTDFEMGVNNEIDADVDIDSKIASVDIRGLSQIGAIAANVAAFNLNGDVTVDLLQTGNFDPGDSDMEVDNDILAEVVRGSVNIDGGYYADADATDISRSVQLGTTTFNALQLYTSAETAGDVTLKLDQNNFGMETWANNRVTAFAGNDAPLTADPSVSNIDQLALASINTVNVTLDGGATLNLQGADADAEGYGAAAAQFYDRSYRGDEFGAYRSEEHELTNVISASTGEDIGRDGVYSGGSGNRTDMGFLIENANSSFEVGEIGGWIDDDYSEAGYGDASISDVAQRSVLSINTISIAGTSDGETTGVAGATTIGSLDDLDFVLTFEQNLQGLDIQNAYTGDSESARDQTYMLNELTTLTGVGNASVTSFEQIQAISGNTLSTTGDLTGVSVDLVDYYPGTVEGGDYGLNFTDITLDDAYTPGTEDSYYSTPDLRQVIGDSEGVGLVGEDDFDFIDMDLLNTAVAAVNLNGIATVGGDQTLAVTLNSLSAGGVGSGFFVQGFDSEAESNFANVELQNLSIASLGDRGMAEVESTTQTGVTSINTMAFGTAGPAVLAQTTGGWDLYLRTDNNLTAGSADRLTESVSVADVTQAVISRVNAISAINP